MMTLALSAHFLIGIVGVILSYAALLSLLKKEITPGTLKQLIDGASVALLAACLGGAYYYGLTPSGILASAQALAFIVIPIAALLAVSMCTLKGDQLPANATLKNTLFALVATITAVSVLLLLTSMYLSGSVA